MWPWPPRACLDPGPSLEREPWLPSAPESPLPVTIPAMPSAPALLSLHSSARWLAFDPSGLADLRTQHSTGRAGACHPPPSQPPGAPSPTGGSLDPLQPVLLLPLLEAPPSPPPSIHQEGQTLPPRSLWPLLGLPPQGCHSAASVPWGGPRLQGLVLISASASGLPGGALASTLPCCLRTARGLSCSLLGLFTAPGPLRCFCVSCPALVASWLHALRGTRDWSPQLRALTLRRGPPCPRPSEPGGGVLG